MTRGAVDSGERREWWVRMEAGTEGWMVISVGGRLGEDDQLSSDGMRTGQEDENGVEKGRWEVRGALEIAGRTYDWEDEDGGRLRWMAEEAGSSDILGIATGEFSVAWRQEGKGNQNVNSVA